MAATPTTTTATQPHGYRLIDPEIEDLATRLAATDDPDLRRDLTERIVLLALPLADRLAMHYRWRGVETDDLQQVARTALVKAVGRYRPGSGPGFVAFAAPTIRGELKRWFRDHGWSVRPPRRMQELRALITDAEEQLRHRLGREPSTAELADALDVTVADVREVKSCAAGYRAASLDVPVGPGAPTSLADHLLVTPSASEWIDSRSALQWAVDGLGERERLVLRLRFVEELTQSEIGERLGVSQMQVSRILRSVLRTLRSSLVDDGTGTAVA